MQEESDFDYGRLFRYLAVSGYFIGWVVGHYTGGPPWMWGIVGLVVSVGGFCVGIGTIAMAGFILGGPSNWDRPFGLHGPDGPLILTIVYTVVAGFIILIIYLSHG